MCFGEKKKKNVQRNTLWFTRVPAGRTEKVLCETALENLVYMRAVLIEL